MQSALVIGLGSMGQRYMRYLRRCAGVTPHGCDLNPETFPEGVSCVRSLDEALDRFAPTMVVIAVPARHHLRVLFRVRRALPDVKVLVEKPLSDRMLTSLERRRCQSLGGVVGVGYNWRFHPFATMLYGVRESIGDLTFHVGSDMRKWPGADYCDPLREFSHEIDLVSHLTHRPKVQDVTRLPDGMLLVGGVHTRGSWCVRIAPYRDPPERWADVRLRQGWTHGDLTGTGRQLHYFWDTRPHIVDAMYRKQTLAFRDGRALSSDSSVLCSLSDALRTTALVDDAERLLIRKEEACRIM